MFICSLHEGEDITNKTQLRVPVLQNRHVLVRGEGFDVEPIFSNCCLGLLNTIDFNCLL